MSQKNEQTETVTSEVETEIIEDLRKRIKYLEKQNAELLNAKSNPVSNRHKVCETPLGNFEYVTPGSLKLQDMVEDFVAKLKQI
jgi:hypothetical protein